MARPHSHAVPRSRQHRARLLTAVSSPRPPALPERPPHAPRTYEGRWGHGRGVPSCQRPPQGGQTGAAAPTVTSLRRQRGCSGARGMLRSRGAGCSGGHPADPWPDSEAPTAWPDSAQLGPARPGSARLCGLGSGQPDPVQLLRSVCGRAAGGRQTIAAAETPAIYHGNKICTVMWSNCSFRFQRELKAGKSRLESSKL